jgi:hypothetical protein
MSTPNTRILEDIYYDSDCTDGSGHDEIWFTPNIADKPNILLTPIAKAYKNSGPCSKRDWEEQEKRLKESQQLMWDDSSKNKSKIGDIFGVWKHKTGVSFHNILDIKGPNERLESWSQNVGHGSRQVLYISPPFSYIDWDSWIQLGGQPRCMGTTCIKAARDVILTKLIKVDCACN